MQQLLFATQNENKKLEVEQMLDESFTLISLAATNIREDIPETGATLQENAHQKASYVYERTGIDCFADDTGLEVESLKGQPGVHTARYAGEEKNTHQNMKKLLKELEGNKHRKARFVTVITLIIKGEVKHFEGSVKGSITERISGSEGFGYDPVFQPEGYQETFSEMDLEEKNKISHRFRAFQQMKEFLKGYDH